MTSSTIINIKSFHNSFLIPDALIRGPWIDLEGDDLWVLYRFLHLYNSSDWRLIWISSWIEFVCCRLRIIKTTLYLAKLVWYAGLSPNTIQHQCLKVGFICHQPPSRGEISNFLSTLPKQTTFNTMAIMGCYLDFNNLLISSILEINVKSFQYTFAAFSNVVLVSWNIPPQFPNVSLSLGAS